MIFGRKILNSNLFYFESSIINIFTNNCVDLIDNRDKIININGARNEYTVGYLRRFFDKLYNND